jgi:hypothetical protein
MKIIKVHRLYCEPETLYEKANTKSQRALLGYMAKGGFIRDPIYVGAFKLIGEIESHAGIYVIQTEEKPKTAMEIIRIAESAMLGMWDDFVFSKSEIKTISQQFGNFKTLGGK